MVMSRRAARTRLAEGGPSAASPRDHHEGNSDPTGHEGHGSERSDVRPDVEERRARIGLPPADPVARAILVLDGHVQRDREEDARAGHVRGRADGHRRVRGRLSGWSCEGPAFAFTYEGTPDH